MGAERPVLDGYVRVSRVQGRTGESYISPSVQREAIQRWADYKGVEIAEWHIDEDWSGGTHQRPGLEHAVDRATNGITGGIVVWKIDRFSRYTEHGLRDLRRLEANGARLAFVTEDIDTSGPMGKFVYTIMLAMAEYFLDSIKASWITAKTRAVERGAFIGPTPYGYRRRDDATLEPEPEQAKHVTEAFRIAASQSIPAASLYLNANAPGRVWTTATVRRLLAARSYLGETRNGELVQPDTHEPLVKRVVWEAAQSAPAPRKAAADFPLSGLPVCGTCGSILVGSRGGTKGNRMRVYRCSATLTSSQATCAAGVVIVAGRLEGYLRDEARKLLNGLEWEIGQPHDADRLAEIETGLLEAEAELEAFAADLTARRALGDRYHAHLQSRADAVESARGEYREIARLARPEFTLSGVDALDDPELLVLALRSIYSSIVVVRGRGLPVDRRVVLTPAGSDVTSGVPGT